MFDYSFRHREEVQMELIKARKKERYAQQNVADYLGVSRITYAKMEKTLVTSRLMMLVGLPLFSRLMCAIFFPFER